MKKPNTKAKKALIIVLGIAVVIAAAGIVGQYILSRRIAGLIESGSATYTVNVKWVKVRLAEKRIVLNGVSLRNRNKSSKRGPTGSVNLKVDRVELKFSGLSMVGKRVDLHIKEMLVDSPSLDMRGLPKGFSDTVASDKKASRHGERWTLGGIRIDNLLVRNGNANYTRWNEAGEIVGYGVVNANVELSEFRLDEDELSSPLASRRGVFFGSSLKLSADRFTNSTKDGANLMEIDSLVVDSDKRSFSASLFAVTPQLPKDRYADKVKGHPDWTKFDAHDIECFGIDYEKLFTENLLQADSVVINGGGIYSLKDKNITQPKRVKNLLYQPLQRLPVKVDIPVVAINGFMVQYEEIPLGKTRPGVVSFAEVNGHLLELTNIASRKDQYFRLKARAMFMESGVCDVEFIMPVDSLNDRFELIATLHRMDMSSLNEVFEPLENMRITSGVINRMDAHIVGSSLSSHTTMTLLYDDLSVVILRKHPERGELGLVSALVNDFLIHTSNPEHNRKHKVRSVEGDAERDPYRSHFNFLWRSLFSGLKETLLRENL